MPQRGSAARKPLRAGRRGRGGGCEAVAERGAPSPARRSGGGRGGGSGGAGRGGAEAGQDLRAAGAAAVGPTLPAPGRFGGVAAGTWAPSLSSSGLSGLLIRSAFREGVWRDGVFGKFLINGEMYNL